MRRRTRETHQERVVSADFTRGRRGIQSGPGTHVGQAAFERHPAPHLPLITLTKILDNGGDI
jgi:hypothetical protein